jgi:inositol-phosphate transport system permease protein
MAVADVQMRQQMRGRRVARAVGRWLPPVGFLTPAVVLVVVFFLVPTVLIVLISFTDKTTITFDQWNFVGLHNYRRMLADPEVWKNAQATLVFVAATVSLFNVGLGLLLALVTTHLPRRAGGLFRAIWLLPRITPVIVFVLMWQFMTARKPIGFLNDVFQPILGGDGSNLMPPHAMLFVVLMSGVVGASFGMIVFTSAIEAIPRDFLNAALVDGAGIWQRIRYVILPALKWPLLFTLVYQTLSLLTSFEYILPLTNGNFGTRVWSLWGYQVAFSNTNAFFEYGYGAAIAVVLVAVGVILSFVYMRFFRFGEMMQPPKIETL